MDNCPVCGVELNPFYTGTSLCLFSPVNEVICNPCFTWAQQMAVWYIMTYANKVTDQRMRL